MGLFGPDKITFMLDKYDYKPGERITGKVKLNLKKPITARKLEVSLYGVRVERQSSVAVGPMMVSGGRNRHRSRTRRVKVFDFKLPISGEKEYKDEEFPFEIKIPDNILLNNPTLEGKLGQAATAVRMLSGMSSRIEWYVKAQLDVPKKLDIKKKQTIILSES